MGKSRRDGKQSRSLSNVTFCYRTNVEQYGLLIGENPVHSNHSQHYIAS